MGAAAPAILGGAMRHDLVDRFLIMREEELSEALAQRAAVLDAPNAVAVTFARPLEGRGPACGRIGDTVGAAELPTLVEGDEDMPLFMGIHADMHASRLSG